MAGFGVSAPSSCGIVLHWAGRHPLHVFLRWTWCRSVESNVDIIGSILEANALRPIVAQMARFHRSRVCCVCGRSTGQCLPTRLTKSGGAP